MSDFGDTEPEDAWDPGDPVPILIDNIFRRLALLDGATRPARVAHGDLLDIAMARLAPYLRMHGLPPRDKVRVDQLADDIAFLRGRD